MPFFTDFACEDRRKDRLDCDAPLEEPIFHVPDKSHINIKPWTIKKQTEKILQSYVIKIFLLLLFPNGTVIAGFGVGGSRSVGDYTQNTYPKSFHIHVLLSLDSNMFRSI